ncbi:UvrD-helicase domain-containing protein [Bifidobacterium sp. CP2]|nr:UvrD-helicase domain-containing protein [Bifidobacterium sp. CP2]
MRRRRGHHLRNEARMTTTFTDSPEQAAVIGAPVHDDVLVVAGAGSGKTYTMTRRIIELIGRGTAPERILGLTFTRKAAGELLDRVSTAVLSSGNDGEDRAANADRAFLKPTIATYDAFFQTIVRQYGLLVGFDQNTQPLSEAGALLLAGDVIGRHADELRDADLGSFSALSKQVLGLSNAIGSAMIGDGVTDMRQAIAAVRAWDDAFIARVRDAIGDETVPEERPKPPKPKRTKKDTDATWQAKVERQRRIQHDLCLFTCAGLAGTAERRNLLLRLVSEYADEKRRRNMAEFSDFTIAAYQLVTRFPSIGERYRERFSHVLLDEYQDTSTTQATLIATLFQGGGTAVSAVGDPFQSIYAWRGASPGAFRMFQRDFHMRAEERPYALSVTRRNARLVLEAANDLTLPLRQEPRRPGSSLMREVDVRPLSTLDDAPEGTVGALGYDTLGQEIDGVVRFCAAVRKETGHDGESKTAAVLFRSKKAMPLYQQALEQAGLTTAVVGYSAMLERPEVRDLLALLRVVSDHTDTNSLMRLLATPRFGLDAQALSTLASLADADNTESRYRALAVAGVVPADAPRSQWASLVREHRSEVANAVFLPDLLMKDDLGDELEREGHLDGYARHAVLRCSRMLRRVDDMVGGPLQDVVRAAAEALDLDIDTVVAQALHSDDGTVNPTLARIPIGAVTDLVDAYTAEIAADATPTLRGFMAWVDALGSIEDEAAALGADRKADVELMTVHQSKGLEWDAVAVVGLEKGVFPSSQGDNLSVEEDVAHPGGLEQGVWTAPEYRESARTWLDDPTAVPVPIRVDAGILPRFPHDASADSDPIASLNALDGVERIDDEVYGSLRNDGDGSEGADPDSRYLTQEEEYGRRLHADERRLMYVALTRARTDVLLTYARTSSPLRDPSLIEGKPRSAKPSNFWLEVHDALHSRADAVTIGKDGSGADGADDMDGADGAAVPSRNAPTDASTDASTDVRTLAGRGVPLPAGMFAGEAAKSRVRVLVTDAWNGPYDIERDADGLPWPVGLTPALAERLRRAAETVQAVRETAADAEGPVGPLLERARMLVADDDLMSGSLSGETLDEAVRTKAQRILAGSRQSVTGLQVRAGTLGEREERRYWRSIVRPIPSVASPSASAGTRFHAWAQRFIDAAIPGKDLLGTDAVAGVDAGTFPDPTRRTMLAGLGADEPDDAVERRLLSWERRLAASPWARRIPAWAERQIVVSLPQLDGIIANGKLDAVFHGGLDPEDDSKRYTVIDWKTGRRPRTTKERAERLAQLDLYRLLLAAVEGLPLDSIDAALYYVSEPDERNRELRAEAKTEQDIIAELSSGVPEQSDDD